jgi:hypothetical protein
LTTVQFWRWTGYPKHGAEELEYDGVGRRHKRQCLRHPRFPRFLAEEYSGQMERLGYLRQPWDRMRQVRSDEKNLPLYRLALFSRHRLAYQYWDEVLKYSSDQRSFEF